MTARPASDAGFTLIEALVAMAVLAVASAGFIRATQGHIDLIGRVEARAAGLWAADNALVAARLGLPLAAPPLLGQPWSATTAARPSDDPAINAVTVTASGGGATVTLRGFTAAGATR